MAKQLMLTATFLALLFLVSASSYRTTIVINEDAPPERRQQQRRQGAGTEGCQGRVLAQQLLSCKQYLSGASGKGPQGYIVLPTRRKEEGGGKQGQQEQQRQQQQQQLQQCCQQLRQVEEKCRCEALKQIVQEEQQQQQQPGQPSQPGQGKRQVQQRATALPAACGMGPQRCEFGTGVLSHRTGFW